MGKFDKPKKKGPKDSKPEPIAPQPAPPGKTGRGHKQKGAGTVIVGKAPMVTNDGVILRAHERLPTQLLQEWTQREKRPAPRYKPRPPGNRHMVFVNDAKNSAYDMNFLPVQTDFESEKVAKDYAALLALEKVQGNMPLENKLPEPYCTVWKEMISTKKEKDKKDIKKAAAAKKEGGGGVVKEPAAPLPAAPPRKLPPAAKDFMFDGGDEEPESPSPPGIQVGTLDPETADWLCGSCNSQNFAKLQSGQLRTKCFKCGALKNDACELVQSTLATKKAKEKDGGREPAAVTRIQMEMTKTKRDDEKERRDKHANAGRPFRGAHTSAVQLAPRGGGGKNRQRKGAPAAVLDLQAKNNRAVEERAREEYNLLKRRRQAYFDAVKRANRPSPVAINPVLKKKLEVVLGLDTEESASASRDSLASLVEGGVEVPSTMEEYLSSVFRESRVDDEGDEDVEASYLSYEDSRVSAEQQRLGLLAIRDALVSTGFSEQQVVRAAEAVRTHGRDRLLDELDDAADSGGAAFRRIGRERSLEWLCLHLSESELPEGLDLSSKYANPGISVGNTNIRGSGGDNGNSGDSKKASTETTTSRGGNSSADANKQGLSLSAAGDAKSPSSTTEAMLVSYGWTAKDSADAASYCGGDPASGENIGAIAASAAVLCNATISTLGDTQCTPVTFSRSGTIGDTEGDEGDFLVTVEEEVEVLQSIYTEENAEVLRVATASLPHGTSGSSSGDPLMVTRVTVDLTLDLSGMLKGSGKTCSAALDVFVVKPGMQYPITPPIALLRCPALAQRQLLLPVQVLLWRKAAELAGDSAVHALASWAQEELAVEAAATNNSKLLSHCPTGLKDVRACARNLFPSSNSIPAEGEDGEGYEKDKQRQKTEPQQRQQEHAPDFRSQPRGGKPRGKGGPFWRRLTAAETASTPRIPDSRRRAMDKMDEGRRKLPAWNSREEFLRYVHEARGVVVTGETGCGKTTQIPQFLNEVQPHAKVVVCQPRRLAAVGVATRVAEERCCGLGEEVGYMVRGDSKCTARTRLAFCTYGVMLRRLLDDPFLEGIDYVILDEVHERNVDSDFGLALLAAALGNAKCRFKLILMSATISTDKFASYLGEAISGKFQPQGSNSAAGVNWNRSRRAATPAPVLEIPGFTFDVDMYYKADYEELLRGDSTTRSPLLASLREHEQQQQEEQEEQEDEEEEYAGTSGNTAYRTNRDSKRIGGTLVKGDIDWDLLVRLVLKLAIGESQQAASNADGSVAKMFSQATGSVLVFLPGVPEINRFLTFLRKEWESGAGGKGSRISLLTIALHGGLSAVDQKKVFVPARKGELKIVAATNVAEASITIPDVSVVVDTCKVKEMYFVPEKQMNALVTKMAPQDSLRQRRGRAGRVARGRCFRLVTVGTHDNLPANGIPEILRVSIDGLILQIKAMQAVRAARGDSKEKTALVLSRCPDPPTPSAILTSEGLLTKMQAIDADSGDITPLGKHLAALPCEPRVGRLLVYGALLGCAFPAAVVAAMLSCQSPFLNSSDPVKREEGNAAKAEFMSQSGYKSDQLAVVAAMRQWAACRGQGERRRFAVSHCLSHDRLGDIDKLAREFLGDLASLGLVVDPVAAALLSSEGRDNVDNCNSNKPKIVAAALCAGLYPQVSRILRPPKRFEGVLGSNFEKDVDGKEIRFYVPEAVVEQPEDVGDKEEDADGKEEEEDDDVRPVRRRTRLRVHSSDEEDEDQGEDEDEGGGKGQMKLAAPSAGNSNKSEIDMEGMFRVFIHPSSVNFSNTIFGHSRYLLYGEISVSMNPGQGFKAYLRDTTEAATYPLLFFGGKLEAQYLQGTITIDNWIKFVASGKQVALIQATRRAFDAILTEKIENPSINHHDNDVVKAVCDLLNSNSNA